MTIEKSENTAKRQIPSSEAIQHLVEMMSLLHMPPHASNWNTYISRLLIESGDPHFAWNLQEYQKKKN